MVSLGHAAFNSDSIKIPITTKENRNRVTNNQHNSSIIPVHQNVNKNTENEYCIYCYTDKAIRLILASLNNDFSQS
jgi:hypothetical protein